MEKKDYEKILKEVWKITPFKVVTPDEFNFGDYLSEAYSFATLTVKLTYRQDKYYRTKPSVVYPYIDFYVYDIEKKKKEIEKDFKKKARNSKYDIEVLSEHRLHVARINFHCKGIVYEHFFNGNNEKLNEVLFNGDAFWGYRGGFLRNAFQRVSDLISIGKPQGIFDEGASPRLSALKSQTLWIPDYCLKDYKPAKFQFEPVDPDHTKKLFKDYKYKYEVQDEAEINKRIMAGEEFYYLKFAYASGSRFVQVINSKTGEEVFRNHFLGLGVELNERHIKFLIEAISESK